MGSLARLSLLKSGVYLSLTGTGADNDLKNLLTAVSEQVETFCNRVLISTTHTDEFQTRLDFSPNILYPQEYPVTSITSLEFWDTATDAYVAETSTYYLLVTKKDSSYIQYPKLGQTANATFSQFPTGLNEIQMTYVAGYLNTDWDTEAITASFGVPADLEKAVCQICQLAWSDGKGSGMGRLGITSINQGAEGLTKEMFQSGSFPDHIQTVLNKYRKTTV